MLKLLAGSIAGAGLGTGAARLAFPDETRVQVGDSAMRLEFDATLRSRVAARQGDSFEPLTDFEPSETLRLADGARIERFPFATSAAKASTTRMAEARAMSCAGSQTKGSRRRSASSFTTAFPASRS